MDDFIDPSWHFIEAVDVISSRHRPGGHGSGPQRNSLIEAWAHIVGRDRASLELQQTLQHFGSFTAACRALSITPPTMKRFLRTFASMPSIGSGEGLAIYFAAPLAPVERFLVEGVIVTVLGRETTCRLVELRDVEHGVVMRFSGATVGDLCRVGDALWHSFWRQDRSWLLRHGIDIDAMPDESLRSKLDDIHRKIEAIELRQPSSDAVEMLNDQGAKHVLEKDRRVVQTWGQRLLPGIAKKAVQFTLGAAAEEMIGQVTDAALEK